MCQSLTLSYEILAAADVPASSRKVSRLYGGSQTKNNDVLNDDQFGGYIIMTKPVIGAPVIP